MTDQITYAKVGGPPDDWERLQVRDTESGALVDSVIEVNTEEGWALISRRDRWRPGMEDIPTEKLIGNFAIERQP